MNEMIKKNSVLFLDETIEKIQELVQINSVRNLENKTDTAAFGKEVGVCLDTFLKMASEIGMRTYRDPEGYYGYAEIGPLESEMIGILAHLDVVPVGDLSQWTKAEPFSGDIVDGCIIGRGSLDNKGAIIMNLMAIKSLIDLGHDFKKRLRFIVGCAEETTWECMKKYNELEEMPSFGYTPDANFPLVNAEKTIHQFDMSSELGCDFELISEGAYNAVADSCFYKGPKIEELKSELDKLNYNYKLEDNGIRVIGKSAHAMQPDKGINAICQMAIALYNIGIHSQTTDFIASFIKEDYYGETLMGELLTENISGNLTLNVSNILINSEGQKVGFDSRIPVLLDDVKIIDTFKNKIEEIGAYSIVKHQDKAYVAIDDPSVSKLMNIYKEVMNDYDAKPIASGGGTYARAMKKGVAFGITFSNFNMVDNAHQPNEAMEIRFITPGLEIYTRAIYELTNI